MTELTSTAAKARIQQTIYEFLMGLPVNLPSRKKERIARTIFGYPPPYLRMRTRKIGNAPRGSGEASKRNGASSEKVPEEPERDLMLEVTTDGVDEIDVRLTTPPPGLTPRSISRATTDSKGRPSRHSQAAMIRGLARPSPGIGPCNAGCTLDAHGRTGAAHTGYLQLTASGRCPSVRGRQRLRCVDRKEKKRSVRGEHGARPLCAGMKQ